MVSKANLTQPTFNSSSWNTPLNANFGVVTDALGAITSVAVTSSNVTLTTSQAQAMGISVTGAMVAPYSLFVPAGTVGTWVLINSTTGGQTLTVYVDNGAGSPAGAGVVPPSNTPVMIYSDGVNVRLANDYFTGSIPAGTIFSFAGTSAPIGYLLCDGSAVSRTTYSSLFSVISTTWGSGDNITTFNVPDLRGAFLRGSGAGLNPSPRSVGTYQADDVKPHTHGVTDPGHSHSYVGSSFSNGAYQSGGRADQQQTRTTSSATTGITINNSTGVETVPKNYAVLYVIKY